MSGIQYKNKTVDQTAARTPVAGEVLHTYHIDSTNRLSLAQAAAMTSSVPDEVLAVIEARMMREARQQRNNNN